jgi:hypothetical protein
MKKTYSRKSLGTVSLKVVRLISLALTPTDLIVLLKHVAVSQHGAFVLMTQVISHKMIFFFTTAL